MTMSLQNLIQTGLDHHKAGRLPQAEAVYRQILQQNPNQPDALYFMGVLASQAGRDDLAIDFMQRSLQAYPSVQAYQDLGNLLRATGKYDEALQSYHHAVKLGPDNPQILNNRANLLAMLDHNEAALADYDRAIALKPDYTIALNNRGNILHKMGQMAAALDSFRRAIALDPNYVDAHHNYAFRLSTIGRMDEAIAHYRKAVALKPDFADAHNNLGNALHVQGQLQEAIQHFRKAIALNPRVAEYHNNLGNIYKELGHLAEAVAHYKKAVEIRPDMADTLYNMGQAYRDMGQTMDAIACYDRALVIVPNHARARWAYAMVHIPVLIGNHENLTALRAAFQHQLEALDRWFNADRVPSGYLAVGVSQPFYLAYQEENNNALLARYGALCARLMKDWQQRHHYEPVVARPTGPVRVGIVSSHIRNHSVWFALLKGWLQHLNRNLIELHILSVTAKADEETDWAKQHVTSFEVVGQNLDVAVGSILAKNLDVLIYPEIGMEQMAHKLASLRLCPTQIVTWGHPETSGLPTVDYFLSADDFEPENAIDNYSELLIRLPHLGCCYQPLAVTPVVPDFAKLGLKTGVPLLLSPGVPFKYAPQHDHIYIDIARKLKVCQIVFFTSRPQDLSNKLQIRLRAAFEKAGLNFDDTCIFIPWLDRPEFYGLMQRADVFLDTIGFSGFNTAIQAVECGLPIVTRDGRFMRGRLASGILRRMELTELIVKSDAAYVDLVVRLATDKTYNQTMRQTIMDRRARLFDDREPVKALEQLLVNLADRL